MTKLMVLTAVLLSSVAAAADTKLAAESTKVLLSAIDAGAKTDFEQFMYLPGYGFSATDSKIGDFDKEFPSIYAQIKGLTTALKSTVKGMDANDWVSFHVQFVSFSKDNQNVVVRQRFTDLGDAEKWEVWLNGQPYNTKK
ncbi:hypothetical protein [Deinococcus peraridilitoris]|uniref:Uncharacterized protein n=1 Tax=Deinococcus peraridilitoris (strain DSM 19664 / LMG 22246 / CIP 109416 / KR-200) TaxID=937777 RepID=L0A0I9_DEIPD|nr:hypothetical protein [Deinococcus peraridilitoris]AFZ66974.1 hypothetical protein Deipe_1433 [Deinococcus peraridilitoris DSM 19664]